MPGLITTPARVAYGGSAAARTGIAATRTAGQATARSVKLARRSAGTGAHAWAKPIKVALRMGWLQAQLRSAPLRLRRPRVISARGPEITAAVLAGAGVEYFLDPVDGKRRRHMLRDGVLATGRRLLRRGAQRARYLEGQAEGAIHEARSTPKPAADDHTLADRVRTDIFRRADAPKESVNVGVVDGIVYLRGEVPTGEEIERLVADARTVPGVRAVESLLHTPGAPTPMGGAA